MSEQEKEIFERECKALIGWFKERYGRTLKLNDRGIDVVVEAMRKQVAEKPVDKEIGYGDKCLVCPNCGQSAIGNPFRKGHELYPHCPWCGQRLEAEHEETE